MIAIPETADYQKNMDKITPHEQCIVCGKPLPNVRHWLMYSMPDGMALTEQEYASHEDAALMPIGPDCLKNNPQLKGYLK